METFVVNEQDFSLFDTLSCGQCFRWRENGSGGFDGVVGSRRISVKQDGDSLSFTGCNKQDYEKWLKRYLGLDADYSAIKKVLAQDPVLSKAIEYAPGIRIMNQPFWETLCSFIISQNNNIPRIMGIVDRLCEGFGDDLGGYFSFPSAETLSELSPQDLAPLRCGFRDRYIIDAAKKCSDGSVDEAYLRSAPLDDARRMLMSITGVGKKVADCTLLFGLGRLEAFPVDVWMKRAMEALFPDGLPELALPYAGIAQQYIFHYARTSGIFNK